jgi:hypothetical protein
LATNGYTEAQVQSVFIKSGEEFPTCELSRTYCNAGDMEDAYWAETYLGDIVQYLKCCKATPPGTNIPAAPRYPNLKQVFVTSRIYGGYANGASGGANTCLNPEPFAYELGFGVQRLVTAQIRQTAAITTPVDTYAGQLDYTVAPWVDWGPYLWASGTIPRNYDQLVWCDGQGNNTCPSSQKDVLYDDPMHAQYFGDYTHPTGQGVAKVANQLLIFIGKDPQGIKLGSPWVMPWIVK